jgi:hypothetical protein
VQRVRSYGRAALAVTRLVRQPRPHVGISAIPLPELPRALFRQALELSAEPRGFSSLSRLGFGAAAEEAPPKELQHQGDDAAEDRQAELQLHELG